MGSIGSAAASSACCWLPLLMVATGFSVAGATAFFESWRPLFLIVAAALLSTGFYLNYRPQKTACGPDGSCPTPSVRLRRLNRGMLWVSAALVLTLALFPNYVGRLFGAQSTAADVSQARTLVIDIEGMTCAGCELAVRTALSALPEVTQVDASYVDARAIVRLAGAATPSRAALTTAVAKAGYTLIAVNEVDADADPPLAGH